jgi:hypothetical protein
MSTAVVKALGSERTAVLTTHRSTRRTPMQHLRLFLRRRHRLKSLSHEELSLLQEEIHGLTQYSVICKIFGSRPNRQELKELYAQSQVEVPNVITDVQLMGKGFYHIKFSKAENVRWLLATNPLDLRGAQAFFSEWYQGFNVADTDKRTTFRITVVFPSPTNIFLFSRIGTTIGVMTTYLLAYEVLNPQPLRTDIKPLTNMITYLTYI